MGPLDSLLRRIRRQRVYIDANFFIYFFNQHPQYFEVVAPIIRAADNSEFTAICGDAVVSEVMVHPYKYYSPSETAQAKRFFNRSNFLTVVRHEEASFDLTAQLRATTSMRMLDALHYATAIQAECRYMLTNDRDFKAKGPVEVVGISSLLTKIA